MSKYCGSILHRKNANIWYVRFQYRYTYIPNKGHKNKEDAEVYIKDMNRINNLPVKNIIYEYNGEYFCELKHRKLMKFDFTNISLVQDHYWYPARSKKSYYAIACINSKDIRFHNLLFPDLCKDMTVDHINRVTLDNTIDNLRPASNRVQAINRRISSKNTTTITGVSYDKERNSYCAYHHDYAFHRKSKYFPISVYGKEEAFAKAVAFRKEIERTDPTYLLALSI